MFGLLTTLGNVCGRLPAVKQHGNCFMITLQPKVTVSKAHDPLTRCPDFVLQFGYCFSIAPRVFCVAGSFFLIPLYCVLLFLYKDMSTNLKVSWKNFPPHHFTINSQHHFVCAHVSRARPHPSVTQAVCLLPPHSQPNAPQLQYCYSSCPS